MHDYSPSEGIYHNATNKTFSCACNEGYTGNGTHCEDVNECARGTHNCHAD